MKNNHSKKDFRPITEWKKEIRLILILFILMFSVFQSANAQYRLLTGTVVDELKEPLMGATVKIFETSKGTITDLNGYFSLKVSGKVTLNISYIGYTSQNISINATTSNINVVLKDESNALNELVVTALDMRRDEKTLTYAHQTVDLKSMTEARDANILNSLSNKVSGVQIISGGGPGSSSTVLIRGNNSITGNNQPLYVIDGVPIRNEMGDNNNQSLDYGNAASNINPDDIENIEVLKGANASALYGSDAANGVILITTKKAKNKNGWGVSLNSNTQFTQISQLPVYQNVYGAGGDGRLIYGQNYYGNTYFGAAYDPTLPWGIANLTNKTYGKASYGPPMLGFEVVGRNNEVKSYSPHPESTLNMYQVGKEFTNGISLDKLTDGASIRFSFTNTSSDDIMQKMNKRSRNAFSLRTSSNITKQFSIDVNAKYTNDKMENRGYRNNSYRNPLYALANLSRDISMDELTPWKQSNGMPYTIVGGVVNPYWILNELSNSDKKDWLLADITLKYKLSKELNFRVRAATDEQSSQGWSFVNYYSSFDTDGDYSNFTQMSTNNSLEALLTFNKRWNKFSLNTSVGANIQSVLSKKENSEVQTLIKPDDKSLANNGSTLLAWENYYAKEKRSIFSTINLGFNNFIFGDITMRNDWSSTLPVKNNSYFYSSAGLSFILTDLIKVPKKILSFAKLRVSTSTVGNDAQFDQLFNGYTYGNIYLGSMIWVNSETLKKNPDLKPEKTNSNEIGADLRFWDNRIMLDATYYSKSTTNQIIQAVVSPMSGYERKMINAGEIKNWGTEISLKISIIKKKNFEWVSSLNWSKNNSLVVSLTESTNRFSLNNFGSFVTSYVQVGQPYGVLYGTDWKRDTEGHLLVDAQGRTIATNDNYYGKIAPDWLGGWNNTIKIGNVDISALIGFQKGGLFWSYSEYQGTRDGNTVTSLVGRDEYLFSNWVLGENDNERRGQIQVVNTVLPGANLTSNYVTYDDNGRISGINLPNRYFDSSVPYWGGQPCYMNVKPSNFYSDDAGKSMKIYTYDASYIKLREVTIGYNLPKRLLKKTFIRTAKLSAVGRNLVILYQKTPKGLDPEATSTTGTGQGFEYGFVLPTATYGFNINITF